MLRTLLTFAPVAALLTITPGVATALVVRSAALSGRRDAMLACAGNSIGIFAWALLAAVGVAAAVAASAQAYTAVRTAGAIVLVALGLAALLRRGGTGDAAGRTGARQGSPLRDGLVTAFANPKLAVFFAALFPQFVPAGQPLLAPALAMAALIVAFDLVYFSCLSWAVARAREAFVRGPWLARAERLSGAVLVGLGVRLALERR